MLCEILKMCTFNCCSLKKNIDLVRDLASGQFDIIALQETFVVEEKLGHLDFIDENYECVGVPAVFSEKVLTAAAGRPEGGMAFLWKKKSNFKVNKVITETNFMILDIAVGSHNILIINVYMNSDIWEIATLEKYLHTLSALTDIIVDMNFDSIFFMGDFNADPTSGRAWRNLSRFMDTSSLKCFDVIALPHDSFTFLSYGNSASRWLDHVIGRVHDDVTVNNIKILHDMIGSDHRPLTFSLEISIHADPILVQSNICLANSHHINWSKLSDGDFKKINFKVDLLLQGFREHSVFDCSVVGCHADDHLKHIDGLLTRMVSSVSIASEEFERSFVKINKFKVIPGWNRNVKSFHMAARDCYLEWVTNGKPLDTLSHDKMKQTRREFKNALNSCKVNEHIESCQSIVENAINKNFRQFWKEVKIQKGVKKNTNIINGKNDNSDICNIFADKFLTSKEDTRDAESEFINKIKQKWLNSKKMHIRMSVPTLRKIILSLNPGMGHDGIHSIFLKNASNDFLTNLSHLLNVWYVHCYLPIEVLKGTLYPTVKDLKGNVTEASNYRPVMQSSCLLKIFEKHTLNILSEKIHFNHRQYGFKRGVFDNRHLFCP